MAAKLLCSVQHQGEGKIDADEMVPEISTEEQADVMLEDVVDLTMEDEQVDRPEFNLDQGEPDLQRFWIQEDDCDITISCYKKRMQADRKDTRSVCKRPERCLLCKAMETIEKSIADSSEVSEAAAAVNLHLLAQKENWKDINVNSIFEFIMLVFENTSLQQYKSVFHTLGQFECTKIDSWKEHAADRWWETPALSACVRCQLQ